MLLLAVSVRAVMGLSGGAPEAACSTITPDHFGSGSNDPVPFTVDISSLDDGYTPGQNYTSIIILLLLHNYIYTHYRIAENF